jgi:hypothetical protein
VDSAGGSKRVRVLQVNARECAETKRAQELLLVQHAGEDPAKLVVVEEREQAAILVAGPRRRRDRRHEARVPLRKLPDARHEARKSVAHFGWEYGGSTNR